jgi:hypothetical protein
MKALTYRRGLPMLWAVFWLLAGHPKGSTAVLPEGENDGSCVPRAMFSLTLGTKSYSRRVKIGTNIVEMKGVLYYLDAVLAPRGERTRLWQQAFHDKLPRRAFPSSFACFVCEKTDRIALAFTQGLDIRFIEADASKPLQPFEKEKEASSLSEYRLANLKSDPTRLGLPSVDGGKFMQALFRGPPKAVGIARTEGKWLVFVDIAGTLVTLARTDGEDDWVLLQNPVPPDGAGARGGGSGVR